MKVKKTKKKIAHIVLILIVSVLIGLMLYQFNATYLVGNRLPMPFGYGVAVVLSGSMEPTLSVDDVVLIKKCDAYELGDIVVYQSENSLVIHKIIQIDGDEVTTRGDANNVADDPFPMAAIKGKMIGKVSGLGAFINLIEHPAVRMILLIGAVALLELSYRKEKEQSSNDEIKSDIAKLKAELGKEKEDGEE